MNGESKGERVGSDVGVDMVAVLDLGVAGSVTGRELQHTDSFTVRAEHDPFTLGADHLPTGATEDRLGAEFGLVLADVFLDVGVRDVSVHGCGLCTIGVNDPCPDVIWEFPMQ